MYQQGEKKVDEAYYVQEIVGAGRANDSAFLVKPGNKDNNDQLKNLNTKQEVMKYNNSKEAEYYSILISQGFSGYGLHC
jgi:hypothetical protein